MGNVVLEQLFLFFVVGEAFVDARFSGFEYTGSYRQEC